MPMKRKVSKILLLSIVRTITVVVFGGLLLAVGYFFVSHLEEKNNNIEQLENRIIEMQNDFTSITNAYITVREDNLNLLRNIEFWKRQCEMLIRENHELKGIPVDSKDISKKMPTPPAPKGKANESRDVIKADKKTNSGVPTYPKDKQVPGRMYDEKGREYIIKNGKKCFVVRKKVPAKKKSTE